MRNIFLSRNLPIHAATYRMDGVEKSFFCPFSFFDVKIVIYFRFSM